MGALNNVDGRVTRAARVSHDTMNEMGLRELHGVVREQLHAAQSAILSFLRFVASKSIAFAATDVFDENLGLTCREVYI